MQISDPTGENYNGKFRKSETGKRCQRWGRDRPRNFRVFCRKVEGKDRPGCIVKVRGVRTFQHCHIPTCPSIYARPDLNQTGSEPETNQIRETILVVYNRKGNKPVMLDAEG